MGPESRKLYPCNWSNENRKMDIKTLSTMWGLLNPKRKSIIFFAMNEAQAPWRTPVPCGILSIITSRFTVDFNASECITIPNSWHLEALSQCTLCFHTALQFSEENLRSISHQLSFTVQQLLLAYKIGKSILWLHLLLPKVDVLFTEAIGSSGSQLSTLETVKLLRLKSTLLDLFSLSILLPWQWIMVYKVVVCYDTHSSAWCDELKVFFMLGWGEYHWKWTGTKDLNIYINRYQHILLGEVRIPHF